MPITQSQTADAKKYRLRVAAERETGRGKEQPFGVSQRRARRARTAPAGTAFPGAVCRWRRRAVRSGRSCSTRPGTSRRRRRRSGTDARPGGDRRFVEHREDHAEQHERVLEPVVDARDLARTPTGRPLVASAAVVEGTVQPFKGIQNQQAGSVECRRGAFRDDDARHAGSGSPGAIDVRTVANHEHLARREPPALAGDQEPARIRFEDADLGVARAENRRAVGGRCRAPGAWHARGSRRRRRFVSSRATRTRTEDEAPRRGISRGASTGARSSIHSRSRRARPAAPRHGPRPARADPDPGGHLTGSRGASIPGRADTHATRAGTWPPRRAGSQST